MDQIVQSIITASPVIGPIMAMGLLALYMTYDKLNKSETRVKEIVENSQNHVQEMVDKFMEHIDKKDALMEQERKANREAIQTMQKEHAMYYKAEQDKFSEIRREERAASEDIYKRLVK